MSPSHASKKIITCKCGNETATTQKKRIQCRHCYATIHLADFIDGRRKKQPL